MNAQEQIKEYIASQGGDIAEKVREIKQQDGPDILCKGRISTGT